MTDRTRRFGLSHVLNAWHIGALLSQLPLDLQACRSIGTKLPENFLSCPWIIWQVRCGCQTTLYEAIFLAKIVPFTIGDNPA